MESQSRTPPLIVIVGQTASGKTAVAIEVAKKLDGEIICADSRTVYKQMNIGTAKPTFEEQQGIPHHLIDIVNPDQPFSAAEFQRLAQKCIHEISSRGKIPIMVGGTGLYIDSVLYNFHFGEQADIVYRQELEQMNDEQLTTLLHTKNIDMANLNTKNRRHVIRAIEREGSAHVDKELRFNTLILGLNLGKEELIQRITTRTNQILSAGFLDEAEKLASNYGWECEAMTGYRVAKEYLEGTATLDKVKAAFIQRDKSLAKRQRTWFKRNPHILWFEDPTKLISKAVDFINSQSLDSSRTIA